MKFYKGSFWSNFKEPDPNKQFWYYNEIALITKQLEIYPAYEEYTRIIEKVFNKKVGKEE